MTLTGFLSKEYPTLNEIIENNDKYQVNSANEDDLYSPIVLESIIGKYDYLRQYPHIHENSSGGTKTYKIGTMKYYENLIKKAGYHIVNILLNKFPQLVIAGGYALHLLDGVSKPSDCDLFIKGDIGDPIDFIDQIFQCVKEFNVTFRNHDIRYIVVTPGVITLHNNYWQKIQIMLREYKSVSSILHGFDIALSSIAYSPSAGIQLTSLAAISLSIVSLIVIPKYSSLNFLDRIRKYSFRKNYDIILPNLDKIKFRQYYLENTNFPLNTPIKKLIIYNEPSSSFGLYMKYWNYLSSDYENPEIENTALYNEKLGSFDNGKIPDIFMLSGGEECSERIFIKISYYDEFTFILDDNQKKWKDIIKNSSPSISEVTFRNLLNDCLQYFGNNIRKIKSVANMGISRSLIDKIIHSILYGPELESVTILIITEEIMDKYRHYLQNKKVEWWIKENPLKQFTVSRHPTHLTPQEFYGEFYIEAPNEDKSPMYQTPKIRAGTPALKKVYNENTCGICYKEFPVLERSVFNCGHIICIKCFIELIKAKLKENPKCPFCRKTVFNEEVDDDSSSGDE